MNIFKLQNSIFKILIEIFILDKTKRMKIKSRWAKRHLQKYVDEVLKNIKYNEIEESSVNKVWIYWHQGIENAPLLIKKCVESIKYYEPNKEVNILSFETISNYVDIPEHYYNLVKKEKMKIAHFSDILRLYLLEKYGGTWIDATIFLTNPLSNEITDSIFFVPSKDIKNDITENIMSCFFITAKKGAKNITALRNCLDLYWSENDFVINYFMFEHFSTLLSFDSELQKEWKAMPNVSAEDMGILQTKLFDDFCEEEFAKIKSKTNIHKLSYKVLRNNFSEESYYNKIITGEKKMIKVSVIVPIYNVDKYLRKCLESLIGQTLSDIEIICVNDGSTDSSLNIIEEYSAKDNRIKIINKENSGYGDSMNRGLNLAKGEYIGILESDDFTQQEMFYEMYNIAKKNNADLVISDFYTYWSNKPLKKVNSTSKYPLNTVTNIQKVPLLLRNKTTIWSAIYKRDFINQYNIRFLTTPGASYQDTSFRIKTIALAERIICLDKAYVRYRQDNANSSVKSKDKVFMICQEYQELTNFLNSNPEIKKYANSEKLINQWAGYVWNLGRIDKEYAKEFVDRFYEEFKSFYDAKELDAYFYKKVSSKDVQLLLNDKYHFMEVFSAKHKKDRFITSLKSKLKSYLVKK